jgi:hypothetical protein
MDAQASEPEDRGEVIDGFNVIFEKEKNKYEVKSNRSRQAPPPPPPMRGLRTTYHNK